MMVKDPEWAQRQKEMRDTQLLVDADDADAVKKYVDKLKKEAEQDVLNALLSASPERLKEQQYYYKAVCRLCEMLDRAIYNGNRKRAEMHNK